MKIKMLLVFLVVMILLTGCILPAPATSQAPVKQGAPVNTPAQSGQKPAQANSKATIAAGLTPSQSNPAVISTATKAAAMPVSLSNMVAIPAGTFQMGDHFGFVDPQHPTDELPLHAVSLSAFAIDKYDITVQQYCDYLNSAYSQGMISITQGIVYLKGGKDILHKTRAAYPYSTIGWDGKTFSVLDNRGNHPVTGHSRGQTAAGLARSPTCRRNQLYGRPWPRTRRARVG